ncbi:MAG: bifunctional methylenetetrahydrofolate dehydrogenase/methenyltetrahydrofolate cyclohydrolase FolD [Rhodospirillaceae bacterium]|jgi:methylenetetrahydrofolate dehydrogenase (NADP+) / methenyltetrahydrofolate cyclohydrolase|nr:bifunctional methylenetetrahydrofolate dehydrogenase/methenyltetrahydrofolate cyclohydrolase FolD [Rhodospirillales bacterium]MBT3905916.1 bifunctional methylenetetrahydrofolate dehydrogenase/methenyltetrahydrofolate cyclohydrolase FolD [Rhodospirillaceae bacterium]MBT4701915.1 bifunctional methylenetetrahydrofolate dehydrogenase/methenyltetrahydrofolate cyclohydrolase FolD [Rhodospirillaceae bacterium]MBT5033529.1 bifunctional methylenetetrahydrofolate dehydrogenase/methenyltetrahydrofolate 
MADARLIDGKAFAANIRKAVAEKVVGLWENHGLTPKLAVVLVGEDPASAIYVRNKDKALSDAGMESQQYTLLAETTEEELLALIAQLNANPGIHGILVQLPLPDPISVDTVINAIDPEKDVDGFNVINVGRRVAGIEPAVTPCTPLGCLLMLKDVLGDLSGKRALVVGRSGIVGKPMAALLTNENCTVTVAHSRTQDLAEECRRADIIIAAIGRPKMIKGDWIKPGAAVIDVGINRIETDDGKTRLVGDVDFAEAVKVAGAITPVPGGVGPVTIACLLRNTLDAACRQTGFDV